MLIAVILFAAFLGSMQAETSELSEKKYTIGYVRNDLMEISSLLRELGCNKIWHGLSIFEEHLIGVGKLMKDWGCPKYLVDAGSLHAIYSTDRNPYGVCSLDKRDYIKSKVGEEAENIIYLNCAFNTDVFFENLENINWDSYSIYDRFEEQTAAITLRELQDLLILNVANSLEQQMHFTSSNALAAIDNYPPNWKNYNLGSIAPGINIACDYISQNKPFYPLRLDSFGVFSSSEGRQYPNSVSFQSISGQMDFISGE